MRVGIKEEKALTRKLLIDTIKKVTFNLSRSS
jgi:hypothetical protein